MAPYEHIVAALNGSGVRYVIVGGVATVLHGYPRVTLDLDVAIDLAKAGAVIDALLASGLASRLPVDPHDFANPEIRRQWIEERNLTVFTLNDRSDPFTQVDIFAEDPIPFDDLWTRAADVHYGSTTGRVASVEDLITMKRIAGRPRDIEDVEALEALREQDGE